MRILRFNETQTYNLTNIREISLDLKDEDIRYTIQPNNDSKIENQNKIKR